MLDDKLSQLRVGPSGRSIATYQLLELKNATLLGLDVIRVHEEIQYIVVIPLDIRDAVASYRTLNKGADNLRRTDQSLWLDVNELRGRNEISRHWQYSRLRGHLVVVWSPHHLVGNPQLH